jgi:hypothetical protein
MNRSHSCLLWSAVVVAGATLTGCPIDALRDGIGAPCVIDGDACPTDHVCHVDVGETDGLCAPILDYGSCGPPSYPQAIGKVRAETLDIDAVDDFEKLRDVVRVEGDLFLDGAAGTVLRLEDVCSAAGVQQVTGSLVVAQTNLTTLDGLQGMGAVGAGVGIAANPNLVDLQGLINLMGVRPPEAGPAFSIVIADNLTLPAEAIRALREVLSDQRGIQIFACGNRAATGENNQIVCPVEVNRLLRRAGT